MMKTSRRVSVLMVAVLTLLTVAAAWAQDVGYAWSLSGNEYTKTEFPLEREPFGWKYTSFNAVAALRQDNVPGIGLGLSWVLDRPKFTFGAGLQVIKPQTYRFDLALGVGVTFRL